MRAVVVPLLGFTCLPMLGGCIAAVAPAGAALMMAGRQVLDPRTEQPVAAVPGDAAPTAVPVQTEAPSSAPVQAAGDGPAPLPATEAFLAGRPAAAQAVPPTMQYLYGSGEAAALSVQAYRALADYVRSQVDDRVAGSQVASVVLEPGSTLAAPRFGACGVRPLAVVLDVDETALLNLGYEATEAQGGGGFDAARWARWEATGAGQVAAVPGAADALAAIRRAGVTVVFNSNRSALTAEQTALALGNAGLGEAKLGQTLFLRDGDSGKDARRTAIAQRFCVVALVGDQLGDFTDLFNAGGLSVQARRGAAVDRQIAALWGAGWFMLPNPVYGTGLKGGLNDVFPADKRWNDPGAAAVPTPAAPTQGAN